MKLGFTGTRAGMTARQMRRVGALVEGLVPGEAHHGDCDGSDDDFHGIVRRFNRRFQATIKLVSHPPKDEKHRAFKVADEERDPEPYLVRDAIMVDECDVIVATPKSAIKPKSLRGQGTWWTIEYARKRGKLVIVVEP